MADIGNAFEPKMHPMRISIVIDDELMTAALLATGLGTKR